LTRAGRNTLNAAAARALLVTCAALALGGCQSKVIRDNAVLGRINADVADASAQKPRSAPPPAVSEALLPPLIVEMPGAAKPVDIRFDISVNNAPANQVFMAMVSGTRYSMLVHPDIREPVSISLKDVTLPEALEAMREVYGYEYKVDGSRIYILPVTMQSRLFQVNYLASRRVGRADVRVSSGSISAPVTPGAGAPGAAQPAPTQSGAATPPTASLSLESSRVTTTSDNDFWGDIQSATRTIIGEGGGRSVVVNANAGVIMVRALPKELRAVEQYLKALSLVVERQVMLEAKIIEVSLSDQYASGINWAAFARNPRISAGMINPSTVLRTDGSVSSPNFTADPSISRPQSPDPLNPGVAGSIGSFSRRVAGAAGAPGAIFGLAFQTSDFAALLSFLESQGTVHVLSSPRIATINNQKAVIKVGTDDFFVTSVQTTTVATGTNTTISPTITTQPFFSGIALDVTPQISDDDLITLHVHPSVSSVTDKNKVVDLGTLGVFQLPLASSTINESDTIVRVQDGTIAAIGGLMRQQQSNTRSGLPGAGDSPVLSNIFTSRNQQLTKSELVILLKVTVIKGDLAWQAQARELNERMQDMARPNGFERR
jgi:MSHA biogenesis protein MshL